MITPHLIHDEKIGTKYNKNQEIYSKTSHHHFDLSHDTKLGQVIRTEPENLH